MSYGHQRHKKTVGIVLLMVVGLIVLIMFQEGAVVTKQQGFLSETITFPNGEKITTYQIPTFLTPEQEELLAEFAEEHFFNQQLPVEYLQQAEQQLVSQVEQFLTQTQIDFIEQILNNSLRLPQVITQEQADLLSEILSTDQVPLNLTASQGELLEEARTSQILQDSNLTSQFVDIEATEATGQPVLTTSGIADVHKRGSIVPISGKIEKLLTLPPYFFNVLITCCGMNSFKAMSAVETDAQGNFYVKITTNLSYPLGEWIVTISTVGDDRDIIRSEFRFQLVE